jgi:hypothetical protein
MQPWKYYAGPIFALIEAFAAAEKCKLVVARHFIWQEIDCLNTFYQQQLEGGGQKFSKFCCNLINIKLMLFHIVCKLWYAMLFNFHTKTSRQSGRTDCEVTMCDIEKSLKNVICLQVLTGHVQWSSCVTLPERKIKNIYDKNMMIVTGIVIMA